MENNRKTFLFFWILLITLLLRDVPYINIIFINQLWIVYLLLLIIYIFSNVTIYFKHVFFTSLFFFVIAMVLSLYRLSFIAEAVGILLYLFFWIFFVMIYENN